MNDLKYDLFWTRVRFPPPPPKGFMMNCYLVWYRLNGDTVDRVRGVARNYKRAEYMAENLKMLLKAELKLKDIKVGVKRGEHGRIYDDEDLSLRWEVNERD